MGGGGAGRSSRSKPRHWQELLWQAMAGDTGQSSRLQTDFQSWNALTSTAAGPIMTLAVGSNLISGSQEGTT